MTSTDSTSSPSSHTARTNRSTSTVVFPVPAPAETNTSPRASTAARCSGFNGGPSWTLHAAHRPEVTPGRARAALGVVVHVAGADALGVAERALACGVDEAPEGLLVEVVVPLVPGKVVRGVGGQEAARHAGAGEGAVDATERLDPDEVAQHEHVQRDL